LPTRGTDDRARHERLRHYGDNLDLLRRYWPDLIYLDPPFIGRDNEMSSGMVQSVDLGEAIQASSERLGFKEKYDLGVLLVHGIGEQARGDTLISQGDPLVRWLRGRVGGPGAPSDPEAKVDVLDVVARQASGDAIPVAHAIVRITDSDGAGSPNLKGKPAHWVVAEAWWAGAFRPATYAELAEWAVIVGPWVLATEVDGIRRRIGMGKDVPNYIRLGLIPISLVVGFALLLVALAAGFAFTVAAVGIFVLALTNLPFVAEWARSLQRNLASGFGDAYVLTRSPVRFAAMAAQVRAGLQVLRGECSAVVLIAESQGTAVAWYALKHELVDPVAPTEEPAPVGLWLTHGQALRKLSFVLWMARGYQTEKQMAAALGTAALLGMALLVAYMASLVGDQWPVVIPSGVVIALLVGLAIYVEYYLIKSAKDAWQISGEDIETDWKNVLLKAPGLKWLDLWASADPFALGQLGIRGRNITSYKIRNLGSALADHVSYWKNSTEFLPMVGSFLFRLGGPGVYGSALINRNLMVPAMRRHARVMLLTPMRVFVGVAVAAGLLYAWRTRKFGDDVLSFLDSLNLPLVGGFFSDLPDWAAHAAGLIAVAALGVVVWVAVSFLWNLLMRRDEKAYFRRFRSPLWTISWLGFAFVLLPATAAGAAALLSLAAGWAVAIAYLLLSGFLSLLCLAVLAGGGKTYAGGRDQDEGIRAAVDGFTGSARVSRAITTVATLFWVLPLVFAALASWAGLVPEGVFWGLLIAECVILSGFLAAEGIRQYLIFRKRFSRRNGRIPEAPESSSSA